MSYIVLARKYRPQTFDELVGQQHVTVTLTNALQAGRIAHGYIFSGPRGCGKTTTARLLAKALNCQKGPTVTPCGKCPSCVEIASGVSPDDVLEIDGASNRGIDDIRNLRDTVKYTPARSRYRIYIIDEAHQITGPAFNALLKTLEEPPSHAVFMMATTEMHKIPSTILSRCQRFQLRPLSAEEIYQQLEKIIKKEKLSVEADALVEVTRSAQGSLRDALSLLDQAVAFSPEKVKEEDVRSLLGLLPVNVVRQFVQAIHGGDPMKVLQTIQKFINDGYDLSQLARDLMDHWHQVLLWKSGLQDKFAPNAKELDAESKETDINQLERSLLILSRCVEQMRRSPSPRVTFELACLQLTQKAIPIDELLERLEKLESGIPSGSGNIYMAPPPTRYPPANIQAARPVPEQSAPVAEKPVPAKPATPSPAVPKNQGTGPAGSTVIDENTLKSAWFQILEAIGKQRPAIEHYIATARLETAPGPVFTFHCNDEFQKNHMAHQSDLLISVFQKFLGQKVHLQFVVDSRPFSGATPAPAIAEAPQEIVDETLAEQKREEEAHPQETYTVQSEDAPLITDMTNIDPGVKKIVSKFPGKLKKIDPEA
ncbi:MAG TPA: DNA polymerase III subunit gamma/tau [Elusimicrobiota bacterium]|nr:DNA polymerase III subunit gamma/tau [Elusimicrobiota bacterium]